MNPAVILDLVALELRRSEEHGLMHSPHEGRSVIDEELDELWDHVKVDTGKTVDAMHEAIQIAAMGVKSFGEPWMTDEVQARIEFKLRQAGKL